METIKTTYHQKLTRLIKGWNMLTFVLGAIDLIFLVFIFQVAFSIIYPQKESFIFFEGSYLILLAFMLPCWTLIIHICNIAQLPKVSRIGRLFYEYFQFTVLNIIILNVYKLISGLEMSVSFIFLFAGLGLLVLYIIRIVEYKILKRHRANGHFYENIILIADGSSEAFIEEVYSRREWGYRILLIFSDSNLLKSRFGDKIKFLPEKSASTLNSMMEFEIVDEVLYLKHKMDPTEVRAIIRSCEEIGVVFKLKTEHAPKLLTNAQISRIGHSFFLTFVNVPTNSIALAFKTTMDIYLSFILILIFSPFMLLISAAIVFTSPGPVIFKQARVGLRGRQFYLFKFRTMVQNAELLKKDLESKNEMDGPVFKIKVDPRITPIGRLLRKTGLDELPQLFNVLKGEMSLIGPRPPLKKEIIQYKRWQLRRLSVKPGITCSWQIITNRNSVKFDSWMKLDLEYIDNWSPGLDFKLLLKTIRTVAMGTGS